MLDGLPVPVLGAAGSADQSARSNVLGSGSMIDAPVSRPMVERFEKARLTPVCCALCGHPVSHADPRVPGAVAGGMCTRATCVKDPKTGKPRQVYTFDRRVIGQ